MTMRPYKPEDYAFRFPNAFVNQVWSGRIPPRIGREYKITTSGRCGGMAFASLDFYYLGRPAPAVKTQDFAPASVPPDGHPLSDYIYTRQLHSMLTSWLGALNGLRFLHWSGLSPQRLHQKSLDEERKAVESLDRGKPVVLGLVKATSRGLSAQGVNHQVVGYSYRTDESGQLEFLVYDPNEPFDASSSEPYQVVFRRAVDPEDTELPYELIRPGRIDRWRGFFVQHYRPRVPAEHVINA